MNEIRNLFKIVLFFLALIETLLLQGVTLVDINVELGQAAMIQLEEEFGHGVVLFVKADITNYEQFESRLDLLIYLLLY